MKTSRKNLFLPLALMAGPVLIAAFRVTAQTFTALHSFTALDTATTTNSDGAYPNAGLILSGNTLYGTASEGGGSGAGTVFKVNADGTGFTNLHSFTATSLYPYTNSDGAYPYAGLILSGNILYGTATGGGGWGNGTVFKLNTDGTGFTTLHNFSSANSNSAGVYTNSDGAYPYARLILSGNTLYGTASEGGGWGNGTVFKLNTDGTGFTTLHNFSSANSNSAGVYTNSDGRDPQAGLLIPSNTLYGTASGGGTSGAGTVFAVNTDGTGFTTLHSFTGGSDGGSPQARLVILGNTLYGVADSGGGAGSGSLFAVSTNGTGFTNLHSFTYYGFPDYTNSDGAYPNGGLILSGSTLYGTAGGGGSSGNGTVFAVNTDGTGFTNLYSFTDYGFPGYTNIDGAYPNAELVLSGSTLYGTAIGGGSSGNGTVFSLYFPPPQLTPLHSFTGTFTNIDGAYTNADGANPEAGLIISGRTLYGTTEHGGSFGNGVVFKVNTDGSDFTNLHSFTGGTGGSFPEGLVISGSHLYGAAVGFSSGYGSVFKLSTDGTTFTTLHSFVATNYVVTDDDPGSAPNYTNTDGVFPVGLVLSGNTMYGTAYSGGGSGNGTVFKLNTDGTGFTTLHSFSASHTNSDGVFTNNEGAHPIAIAGLILSSNTLYGTTFHGGSSGNGTVFAVGTDGSGFTNLHGFTALSNSANSDGARPFAGLVLSGNALYGTAEDGGSSGYGTVFRLNTDGTGFTILHSFIGGNGGSSPQAGLVISGNTLYGVADSDGSGRSGTLFKLNTDGTGFATLYSFTAHSEPDRINSDGVYPDGTLILSGDTLYGTAYNGGGSGNGTVFGFSLESFSAPRLTIIRSGANVILSWPITAAGFTLQSTTTLFSPAVWVTVSPAPVIVNGESAVTNTISGTRKFYRLSK